MYSVVVADDHPAVRLGVKLLIESCGPYQVASEASNSSGLVQAIEKNSPDVVITDLSMDLDESSDGLVMIRRLRTRYPQIAIVVLTVASSEAVINSLVALGTKGVVSKCDSAEELAEAIRYLGRPGTFVSKGLRRSCLAEAHASSDKTLTTAEVEVLRMLANNLSVTAIAARSSRTVATISNQKASAMRKLDIQGNAQLYAYLSRVRNGSRLN